MVIEKTAPAQACYSASNIQDPKFLKMNAPESVSSGLVHEPLPQNHLDILVKGRDYKDDQTQVGP